MAGKVAEAFTLTNGALNLLDTKFLYNTHPAFTSPRFVVGLNAATKSSNMKPAWAITKAANGAAFCILNLKMESMTKTICKEKLKGFLLRFLRDYDLREDEDLFAIGSVNSMFAMQLVLFVEQEFKINVENEDLDIENFKSINAIADLIERKGALV